MEDVKDINKFGTEQDNTQEKDKNDPMYRGKVLMQHALEQLEQGNMEQFNNDRKLANKYFDEMDSDSEELDALYNESRNFGIAYNVIEANVPSLLETKEGKRTLRKIVGMIKGDKTLHEQFKAYNNLMPENRIVNADEYINEAVSMIPEITKEEARKSNEKLIKVIREENLNEMVDIEEGKLNLYESIEYLITNRKTLSNIDEYTDAKKVIRESIEKLPEKEDTMTVDEYEKKINEISEQIAGELNHDEIKLIMEATSGNREDYFNECKKATLNKLNSVMSSEKDHETRSRLSRIYEKINSKNYVKENAIVDIAEMVEIRNTFDE